MSSFKADSTLSFTKTFSIKSKIILYVKSGSPFNKNPLIVAASPVIWSVKKAASLFGIGLALYRDEEEQNYFNAISFEDPWTDELKTEYAEQIKYLEDYKANNGVSEEELNVLISQLTGQPIATPDTINYIIEYLTAAQQ